MHDFDSFKCSLFAALLEVTLHVPQLYLYFALVLLSSCSHTILTKLLHNSLI